LLPASDTSAQLVGLPVLAAGGGDAVMVPTADEVVQQATALADAAVASGFGLLRNLTRLVLEHNNLTGTLPFRWGLFSNLEVGVHG
jgi:hypothetical protein